MQWFNATCKMNVIKINKLFLFKAAQKNKEIINEIINIITDKIIYLLSIYNYNIKMLINVLFRIFRITM